ncbi:MAG: hypothetical protein H0V76_12435, partial [Blastocatellia bacterium]|nr:hypothetical protein [Blastocatellia bacterium]
LYADTPVNETGRVVYFRRVERLLLRVQGRTPNDDAARFSIKFAGSFAAVNAADFPDVPELPVVRPRQTDARAATSAGTLIAQPTPEEVRDEEAEAEIAALKRAEQDAEDEKLAAEERRAAADVEARQTPKVVITENIESPPMAEPVSPLPAEVSAADEEEVAAAQPDEEKAVTVAEPAPPAQLRGRPRVTDSDPTASLSLLVVFRNGGTIRRPMPEISRFQVDRGVLTIVGADGTVGRYSMAEVAKVTIE